MAATTDGGDAGVGNAADDPHDPSHADPAPPRWHSLVLSAYLTLVVGGTLVAVLLTAPGDHANSRDLLTFVVLSVTASVYDVVARRIERLRRRTNVGPYFTMNSVWTFCAAVVLPVWMTAIFVVLVFVQDDLQTRLDDNAKPLYRTAFNTAAVLLPCLLVHHLVDWSQLLAEGPAAHSGVLPLALTAAIAVYTTVNAALVVGVLVIASRSLAGIRGAFGSAAENLLEVTTLALGGLLALATSRDVWLVVLVLPILVLLQRIALVDHLESAASSDGKTGLLNAVAWTHVAERELTRLAAAEKPATVMIIDLDHFKQVNDVYGHLAGDAVLKAVADCMAATLRDRDLLSRFGGEEFVALLPLADHNEALRIAERLRLRIADVAVTHRADPSTSVTRVGGEGFGATSEVEVIRVTVSIGLASYPSHADDVTTLLARADAALYEAKRAGRNRVHISA